MSLLSAAASDEDAELLEALRLENEVLMEENAKLRSDLSELKEKTLQAVKLALEFKAIVEEALKD